MINFKWEGRCVANLTKDSLPMRRFEGCVAFKSLDSIGNLLSLCSYTVQWSWGKLGIKHFAHDFPLSFPVFSRTIYRVKPQIRAYFHAISQPLWHYNEIISLLDYYPLYFGFLCQLSMDNLKGSRNVEECLKIRKRMGNIFQLKILEIWGFVKVVTWTSNPIVY